MKTLLRTEIYSAPHEQVFKAIDDLGVTGMHMTQSSMMMMGSKLNLEFLTSNHSGLGSRYRWTGKIIGMELDFTVEVTKWINGKEKTWETVGKPKLIIFSWYRMLLSVFPLSTVPRQNYPLLIRNHNLFLIKPFPSFLQIGTVSGA